MKAAAAAVAERPAALRRGGYLLSRAGWRLTQEAYRSLASVAVDAVVRLQGSVAEALNGKRTDAAGLLLDWPEGVSAAEAWGSVPDVTLGCHRCDMIFSGDCWNIVEINCMNAGGWILPALHRRETGGDDAGEAPDPLRMLFAHLIRRSKALPGALGDKRIALIRDRHTDEFGEAFLERCREAADAAEPGWDVVYSGWEDVRFDNGGVATSAGSLRLLVELELVPTMRRLQAQHVASRGALLFVAGPVARIVNDKRWLVPLSESCAAVLSTRLLADEPGRPANRGLCRPAEALERRSDLVVKKALSDGGTHVYAGAFNTAEAWRRLIARAAAEGDWVVQRWLKAERPPGRPSGEPLPPDAELVFSPFVIAGRFAGGFVRVLSPLRYEASAAGSDEPVAIASTGNGDRDIPVFVLLPPSCGATQ